MRIRLKLIKVGGWAASLLFLISIPTLALPYGSGSYGTCTYDQCGISLTTSGTVNLSLHPTGSGVYTIQKDALNVKTGGSTGYTLSLESNTASAALISGSNTIPSVSASYDSPQALGLNSWGYRMDSVHNFGAGPTSAITNGSSSSLLFAPLPVNASPDIIVSTTAASLTAGDDYSIWYGVRADMAPPAGTYTQTILYTATQKP